MSLTSPEVSAFADRVPAYLKRLERSTDALLPAASTDPERLHEAMRYACDGGKHLRALMVYAAGEALGVPAEKLDASACAVELIHAYSLVHDDLPAMDNDDLRRGRPTVHKAYDEAIGILVGDALQTSAFEVLAITEALDADQKVRMIRALAHASGSLGMVGGQAVDMASENKTLTLAQLESLHARKTGALILVTCQLAGIAANASQAAAHALERYGKCIGLAFQIQDDVLDQIADTATLGKTAGKDLAQHKSTFPSLLGLEQAKQRADALFEEARDAARNISHHAEPLLWLADFIQQRDH
ncbi:polyprenyl synthetase family protein [Dyella nitratireducens]|uniref:Geranyltranstransferase n=1 Tax=Dyella nitratireducens TaxID=1849580 RepID=A0ABQ1FRB5_9GAMM|nr:farnesyl diphosphate synthase [Dyella nitratireducens]GGA26166.1 geranyltranstransferase [Dyella nitratireducens]GLQ43580.1 geranyltranstransferase [Dyella nitratireducens]